jgi:hypothetical protein
MQYVTYTAGNPDGHVSFGIARFDLLTPLLELDDDRLRMTDGVHSSDHAIEPTAR